MKFEKIKIKIEIEDIHNEGKSIEAANWLLKAFDIQNANLKGFELRKKADSSYYNRMGEVSEFQAKYAEQKRD
jgi:hypothetical protein